MTCQPFVKILTLLLVITVSSGPANAGSVLARAAMEARRKPAQTTPLRALPPVPPPTFISKSKAKRTSYLKFDFSLILSAYAGTQEENIRSYLKALEAWAAHPSIDQRQDLQGELSQLKQVLQGGQSTQQAIMKHYVALLEKVYPAQIASPGELALVKSAKDHLAQCSTNNPVELAKSYGMMIHSYSAELKHHPLFEKETSKFSKLETSSHQWVAALQENKDAAALSNEVFNDYNSFFTDYSHILEKDSEALFMTQMKHVVSQVEDFNNKTGEFRMLQGSAHAACLPGSLSPTPVQAIDVEASDFDSYIGPDAPLTLVDFWLEGCGNAISSHPAVDEIAKKYSGRVKVIKVMVSTSNLKSVELAEKYEVTGSPTLMLFQKGKPVGRLANDQNKSTKNMSDLIEKHLK